MVSPASILEKSLTTLAPEDWQARRRAHDVRITALIADHRERAAQGTKHPIFDFLFTYYSHRPTWLRRWHPGPDLALMGDGADEFLRWPEYARGNEGVILDVAAIPDKRRESIAWFRALLRATADRPALYGCHGLHEWAMVYRQSPDEVRHNAHPLRFAPEEIAAIVERHAICCTHYDAFRFFTAPARPLNRTALTRPEQPQNEQRGCLHANMDLYKWAYKLAPYSPSELVADCFELAFAIREVDMRASPYDLRHLGYPPIPIETPEGKAIYEQHQRDFASRAIPLRTRLIALCDRLLTG